MLLRPFSLVVLPVSEGWVKQKSDCREGGQQQFMEALLLLCCALGRPQLESWSWLQLWALQIKGDRKLLKRVQGRL